MSPLRVVKTHFRSFSAAVLCSTIPLLMALSGCGAKAGNTTGTGTGTGTGTTTPAPTVTMAANPTTVTAGTSATLTVTATNATAVTITGSDGSSYSLQPTGGTQTVTPTATTTYTATATGAGGTATATAKLTVNAAATPAPTITISASAPSITAGTSDTLTITATNATQIQVNGSDGTNYNVASATGGTVSIAPTATTTYTATAVGAGGTTSANVTVTVTAAAPPTISITASQNNVSAGTAVTLTVVATNATQVSLTGSDGSSYTLANTGGTQSVTPKQTTTYTASASGPGATTPATASVQITIAAGPAPTVTIVANPTTIASGNSSVLTVTATNATTVTISGSDGSNYTLSSASGGTQSVSPSSTGTVTYTATATGSGGTKTATATVTVVAAGSVNSIDHVIFMMQENRTFDAYFGMLNPYYAKEGITPTSPIDGIDDKLSKSNQNDSGTTYKLFPLTSSCVDDMSSAWLESFGDVNRYDFAANRPINMDGFVHTAEGFATSCAASGTCSGQFTDTNGERSMGYYADNFLNYYYYMASQFAVSDRWFSPVASKTIDNRIATFSGGTTQGLTRDPGSDDHSGPLSATTIFQELDKANVSWKIYYTVTQGMCLASEAQDGDCPVNGTSNFPGTDFSDFTYAYQYIHAPQNGTCAAPTVLSGQAGDDPSNSFCIDPNHIAPLSQFYTDLKNGTLPSFAFIEAGYGNNDEHPGSSGDVLVGQQEVANIIGQFMASSSWKDSVFFFAYDEGGGPYEHVPPVPSHSNDYTDASVKANYPDIGSITVAPDSYAPCPEPSGGVPTTPPYCDLQPGDPGNPGTGKTDVVTEEGFGAQIGFRVPNMIISPFVKQHYVGHIPMDHTAVIKFVESRFIPGDPSLTKRDAAQPNLLDFFDFTNIPWATPPTNIPTPNAPGQCNASSFGGGS